MLPIDGICHLVFDDSVDIIDGLHRASERRLSCDVIVIGVQLVGVGFYPREQLAGLMEDVREMASPRHDHLDNGYVMNGLASTSNTIWRKNAEAMTNTYNVGREDD